MRTFNYLLLYICYYVSVIRCDDGLDNWPSLSANMQSYFRAQRDISKSVPIDQLTGYGVSLNTMIFDKYGYSKDSLDYVVISLNVGVQTLMLDLYFNEFTDRWQLCPAPFPNNATQNLTETSLVSWQGKTYQCQPSLTVTDLMNSISTFFSRTNTNLEVSYAQIILNLKAITYNKYSNSSSELKSIYSSSNPVYLSLGNSSLSDSVAALGTNLFTPINQEIYATEQSQSTGYNTYYNNSANKFPSLNNFLYVALKRTLISVETSQLKNSSYVISDTDKNMLFFEGETIHELISASDNDTTLQECAKQRAVYEGQEYETALLTNISLSTHFRYIVDDNKNRFTNMSFHSFIRCGLTPILNSSTYDLSDDENNSSTPEAMNYFVPLSFWSWSPDQQNNLTLYENATSTEKDAYKCAVIEKNGWKIGDCYKEYAYACQNSEFPLIWEIKNHSLKSYFDVVADDDSCSSGYKFGVPLSSLQMISLMDAIEGGNISYPVWIDINDITVSGCYVTGGPYASCPYQKTVTKSELLQLIAPSFSVSIFLLLLIVLDRIFKVNPIQTNRRRAWKKILNEYSEKNDYEGVPS